MSRSMKALLSLASIVGLSSVSFAGTTANVPLSGTVNSTLAISSSTASAASSLDLMHGQQIVKVADIHMATNNEQGLTLTATSGDLTKNGGTAIAYQVTSVADDAEDAPSASDFLIESGEDYTVGTSAAGESDVDLYVMFTPASLQDPGQYTGQINLTVSDN